MKTNAGLITGMIMIAIFISIMVIPVISVTAISMDKMNQMNRLTSTVDYGFELDK
jgi:hypothetical protein